LEKLEKRANHLAEIMNRKMQANLSKLESDPEYNYYTKNYRKVQQKYRITWQQIVDIKFHWLKLKANEIAKSNDFIVVDTFKQPSKKEHENIHPKMVRKINHKNRFHCMYKFNEYLKHACDKYDCKYLEAPKDTTRTCNKCGFVNKKLELGVRNLVCERCGYTEDRDINAALNCYDYFYSIK
jgi:putative transposase